MRVGERISRRPRWRLLLGLSLPCLISNSQHQHQHQSFCKKTPFIWVLPSCMYSNCKAARQGLFHALPCL